jgi:hypothetical protein
MLHLLQATKTSRKALDVQLMAPAAAGRPAVNKEQLWTAATPIKRAQLTATAAKAVIALVGCPQLVDALKQ